MFVINGIEWEIKFVRGASSKLMRSDGSISLAVTDWNNRAIYVSDKPKNGYLRKYWLMNFVIVFAFPITFICRLSRKSILRTGSACTVLI